MTIIAHRAMSLARNDGPDGRGELTKAQTSPAERMSKTSARSHVQLKEDEGARFETIRSGRAEEARAKHKGSASAAQINRVVSQAIQANPGVMKKAPGGGVSTTTSNGRPAAWACGTIFATAISRRQPNLSPEQSDAAHGTQNPTAAIAPKCMKAQRADAPSRSVFALRTELHQNAAK
jgi:hypothetical protein